MAITALTAIAALAVCYILLQKMISQPIDHLLVGIGRFSEGDLSQPIGLEGRDEFAEIGKTLDLMAKRLGERTNQLASQNADLEQAVAERTSRLEHLLAEMKRSEASRRRMLADVSHELRTPLTLIRGEADIALRGEPKTVAIYQEALTKVREASEHTAHLVDDLLFIARNESGHARLRVTEVDLKELLAELPQNGGRPAQLVTDLGTAPIKGDADRLRQVLLILLENARHYGGDTIIIRLNHSPDGYRLAVEDDGPGMSDAEKENAFTRYFRGSNAAERYASGVGLGLPVANAIVEAHGGQIVLEDNDGGGLVAAITLPMQRPLRAVS
jgi:signal transduction histidine kinase